MEDLILFIILVFNTNHIVALGLYTTMEVLIENATVR